MAFKKGQSGNPTGKPKGAVSKPQIRNFVTEDEIKALVVEIKTSTDLRAKIWLAEQLFGKAMQAVEMTGKDGENLFEVSVKVKQLAHDLLHRQGTV